MIIIRRIISTVRRPVGWTIATGLILGTSLLAASCGGSAETDSHSVIPPANISNQEVEKTLKYDSRVQDFDTDGDKLVVEVNKGWVDSPTGMQQRALDGWFVQWKAEHAGPDGKAPKAIAVEVKYDGNVISRATPDKGVEILAKPATKSENTE
jgi:hypothetical protein